MDKHSYSPLIHLQSLLQKAHVDALLVRSTDRFFNEYVPEYLSARAFITGFNGSVGDAIISPKSATLFVDGRYALQARNQALGFDIDVSTHGSIEERWLSFIANDMKSGMSLAFDPETISLRLYEKLLSLSEQKNIELVPNGLNLIREICKNRPQVPVKADDCYMVPLSIAGQSTKEKLSNIEELLYQQKVDAFLSVKLDDIAWLLNMRGNYFPYQSTIPALMAIMPKRIILCPLAKIPQLDPLVTIVKENEFYKELRSIKDDLVIGFDEEETSQALVTALRSQSIAIKRMKNPLAPLKAIKNAQELNTLYRSFRKADHVVHQTHNFVIQCYEKGEALSESQIDHYLKEQFTKSGARELSFRPICAGGKHGAIIHYGTPDHKEKITQGSLFLLDCGAFYEGGYATDLTRTFLAAGAKERAKPWQKEMFTLVLKASIKGLRARFRRGTVGKQLDALVREPIWQAGLDYAHGTGHGIGINVHEFPPRIGPTSNTELKEGQVFSIEPGIYIEGQGGVRIENLATIVFDPEDRDFLLVQPLTFCPLDERLIDETMLDNSELEFLEYFKAQWQSDNSMPALPPRKRVSFIEK